MHTFPPDWKPDYPESFIAGLHLRAAIIARGFEADDRDALHWQTWTQSNGNKLAFFRGMEAADAYAALRNRPRPDGAPDITKANV